MALRLSPSASFLQAFLPLAQNAIRPTTRLPLWQRWRSSMLPTIIVPIPGIVSNIWESILRAVPKKKTSHMKKRHRQMAGKALKDVTALNTCSSCGRQKRAHILCPYCVASRYFGHGYIESSDKCHRRQKVVHEWTWTRKSKSRRGIRVASQLKNSCIRCSGIRRQDRKKSLAWI